MLDRSTLRRACAALLATAAALGGIGLAAPASAEPARRCLSDCTPRIGIVSAFGAEADILVAQTRQARCYLINGNRFTTGVLRGNRVVIVLSGVSMINSTMVTQLMLDHFKVERLVMSGIAGGVNPAHHVGDVTVPDRWVMPMEVYWNHDASVPAACGKPGDVSCLGLQLAGKEGQPYPSFTLKTPQGDVPTGLFMRANHLMTAANAPKGEFRFDYPVDAAMLETVRSIEPKLERCGPRAQKDANGTPDPKQCVKEQPKLIVGGRGVSGTAFLANPQYRQYLFEQLQAETVEMETAALAHVAAANGVPYIAFRSLSDLAGGGEGENELGTFFRIAADNSARVLLAFLAAWK